MVGEVNYEEIFYGEEENPVDDLLYPITGTLAISPKLLLS